jgi:hypothetical protein
MEADRDRPAYPRLMAPAYFHAAGLPLFPRRSQNGDLGGVLVQTDEPLRPGRRLKLEIFLPDETSVLCQVRVAWVDRLPEGAPARYEVGLRFVAIDPLSRERLTPSLSRT